MIPGGWREAKIREVAKIDVGRDLVEERFARTISDTHRFPIYSNTVEQHGHYGFYDFPEYSAESVTVVGRGIGLGTAFARKTPFGAIGRLLVLSPKDDSFDVGYLADYLNHGFEIHYESGGIPQLPGKTLGNYSILLPPLPEQRRIAEILSTWDRAIETVEALIANARAQKKALMQSLLTGKHRLPGFSEEWAHQKIEAISSRINARNDGTSLPVLTISSTAGFVRQDEKYSRFMAGKSVESYIILREGEFAYNKGNSKTYEFGCVLDLDGYKCGLVPHVYVCFKLKPGYSHRFYKALFEADYLAPQLGRLVNTGVRNNGLLNITPAQFLGTSVPVPPLAEQEAIAAIMEAASRSVSALKSQLTALRQEKSALMQQLLTGKRRVRVDLESHV